MSRAFGNWHCEVFSGSQLQHGGIGAVRRQCSFQVFLAHLIDTAQVGKSITAEIIFYL